MKKKKQDMNLLPVPEFLVMLNEIKEEPVAVATLQKTMDLEKKYFNKLKDALVGLKLVLEDKIRNRYHLTITNKGQDVMELASQLYYILRMPPSDYTKNMVQRTITIESSEDEPEEADEISDRDELPKFAESEDDLEFEDIIGEEPDSFDNEEFDSEDDMELSDDLKQLLEERLEEVKKGNVISTEELLKAREERNYVLVKTIEEFYKEFCRATPLTNIIFIEDEGDYIDMTEDEQ